MQLVEGCAATKAQFVAQEGIGEDGDNRPADDKVLLNLSLTWPRHHVIPGGDVILWNHSSISGGRRTIMRQCSSRSDGGGDRSGSPACLGSSSTHGSGPRADSAANI